jgi:hypothetical protein
MRKSRAAARCGARLPSVGNRVSAAFLSPCGFDFEGFFCGDSLQSAAGEVVVCPVGEDVLGEGLFHFDCARVFPVLFDEFDDLVVGVFVLVADAGFAFGNLPAGGLRSTILIFWSIFASSGYCFFSSTTLLAISESICFLWSWSSAILSAFLRNCAGVDMAGFLGSATVVISVVFLLV